MDNIAERIADKVKTAGGRTFYVGGFVRDRLLGIDNKDTDIEVHGITPDKLMGILGEIGEPLCFGQSFGIYSLRGESIDIAMPRRERKSGTGHRDFDVDVDPFIGTFEAARRRDFTINAMMEDVLSGEIIDHFGGRRDLSERIIRHVDPATFTEDPTSGIGEPSVTADQSAPATVTLNTPVDLSTILVTSPVLPIFISAFVGVFLMCFVSFLTNGRVSASVTNVTEKNTIICRLPPISSQAEPELRSR